MKEAISQIRVQEEKTLLGFMKHSVNAPVVEPLLKMKDALEPGGSLSGFMKGYRLQVSESFGGNLFKICNEVIESLDFEKREIEFYIANSPEINAGSIFNRDEGEPHYIILNAGLLEKLNEEELKFVLGHEIGHLIYEHSLLSRLMQFIYPEFGDIPPYVRGLYSFWTKLGEISADRLGLIAAKDIDPAIVAMFKISSGLDQTYIDFDAKNFIEMAEKMLSELSGSASLDYFTHPADPIRVKALELFYNSNKWKQLMNGETVGEDEDLVNKTKELVDVLRRRPRNEMEQAELEFLASAGYLLMISDEDVSIDEHEYLMGVLSQFVFLPQEYLKELCEEGPKKMRGPLETMKLSGATIMEKYPHRRIDILRNLFPIITRDRVLNEKEVEIFMNIATRDLEIPLPEALELFLQGLRALYRPRY